MHAENLRISVVIPHLNQPEQLEACLRSLESQSLERSAFEIIVVDNGSASLPEVVAGRHAGVRLLQELRPGPGLARNLGAEYASGQVLCFIDADCIAHRDWLRGVANEFASAPPGTVLGGDVQIWRADPSSFTALEAYESVFAYRFKLYIEQHGYSGTGNLAVSRMDFRRAGPFGGINVAEDVEWGARARAAGLTFRYVPGMVVYHPARRSMRELFVKWDRHIQHALNMSAGKPWWRLRWLARTVAVLASPAVDVWKVVFGRRVQGASARMKGSAALVLLRSYRAWRMLAALITTRGVLWNRDTPAGLLSAGE
jgi:glycosyltransferase involved in cell wall biosynthesis